jgi:hypothetical protein
VAGGAAWCCAHEIGWADTGRALASVLSGTLLAIVLTIGGFALLRLEEFRELVALVGARRRRRALARAGSDS